MRYASIDIETTGINPKEDQILEVGIVIADTEDLRTPICDLPHWRKVLHWYRISGDPYALHLNAGLIEEIKEHKSPDLVSPEDLEPVMLEFFKANGFETKVTPAGKNFSTFDRFFLESHFEKHGNGFSVSRFMHRTLDPMHYFTRNDDKKPPDTKLCCERAGIKSGGHRALDDARMVVHLLRIGMNRDSSFCKDCGSLVLPGITLCEVCSRRRNEEINVLRSISLGSCSYPSPEA